MAERARSNLRERHNLATREQIVSTAMAMLERGVDVVSHEAIAEEAGMSARTVYRHYADRAALLQAMWVRLREVTHTRFPTKPSQVVPFACETFSTFDVHEALVRAVIRSPAGTEVRNQGGGEGRSAFNEVLSTALKEANERERRKIVAVFVSVYSAPFWQLLHDRGGLSGEEVRDAIAWTLQALLTAAGAHTAANHHAVQPDSAETETKGEVR